MAVMMKLKYDDDDDDDNDDDHDHDGNDNDDGHDHDNDDHHDHDDDDDDDDEDDDDDDDFFSEGRNERGIKDSTHDHRKPATQQPRVDPSIQRTCTCSIPLHVEHSLPMMPHHLLFHPALAFPYTQQLF